MKKLIRNIVMWAFDNKVTYSKSSTIQSTGSLTVKADKVHLDGYVTKEEFEALKSQMECLASKENTATDDSDVIGSPKLFRGLF